MQFGVFLEDSSRIRSAARADLYCFDVCSNRVLNSHRCCHPLVTSAEAAADMKYLRVAGGQLS